MGVVMFSCSPTKQAFKSCDTTQYNMMEGSSIIFMGVRPVARVEDGVELAYDDGKLVRECKVIIYKASDLDKAVCLIAYIHDKKSNYEIEVELEKQWTNKNSTSEI